MFFKSNLDLWDDVSVLNKESLYWLYANFKNLLRQAGRNNTLSKIAKNIFDSNNVGLGEYILQVNTPKRDVLDFRSGYTRREPVFKTSAINKTYEFTVNTTNGKKKAKVNINFEPGTNTNDIIPVHIDNYVLHLQIGRAHV